MGQFSQSKVYWKNNPHLTIETVHCAFTMSESFGDRLREQLDAKGMRPAELARRSGLTKQGIGRLLNKIPHAITGAPPKPALETVDKIARALDWDINEARLAAGYAPARPEETYDVMDDVILMFRDEAKLTPEEKEKILNIVRTVALGVVNERKDL